LSMLVFFFYYTGVAHAACSCSPRWLLRSPIDLGNLHHPLASFRVFEREDLVKRPVKMVGNIGYLLVKPHKGVA